MSLQTWLATRPDRCVHGWHIPTQGCRDCTPVAPTSEWAVFTAALRSAVRSDRTVHQCDVRPLIRGRIEPKHIGQNWKRARREGLLLEAGLERSDDEPGKNAGRWEPYYELRSAA